MNRKQRREMKKIMGEAGMEKLADKVFQYTKLPESCSSCHKEYDKTNKEMALTWKVTARQDTIRLFCPECLQKVQEVFGER
jgi:hypothetical protein